MSCLHRHAQQRAYRRQRVPAKLTVTSFLYARVSVHTQIIWFRNSRVAVRYRRPFSFRHVSCCFRFILVFRVNSFTPLYPSFLRHFPLSRFHILSECSRLSTVDTPIYFVDTSGYLGDQSTCDSHPSDQPQHRPTSPKTQRNAAPEERAVTVCTHPRVRQ